MVGAGPAGSAAAIRLLRRRRDLTGRVLLIDKAFFPRHKLCAGGITRRAEAALVTIGATMPATAVNVTSVELRLRSGTETIRAGKTWPDYIFRVIQRNVFDHSLVCDAANCGAVVHEGEGVKGVAVTNNAVTITSDRREYRARVAIAADGANSLVRRRLGLSRPVCLGAAGEALIPARPDVPTDRDGRVTHAVFDFGPTLHGLQGYYWEFPTIAKDVAMVSAGVADSRIFNRQSRRSVVTELRERCDDQAQSGSTSHRAKGAPMRWFHPRARHSAHRMVFAGDAAGADPLFGEGISSALEFGIYAADAVVQALDRSDFSFSGYDQALSHSSLGSTLNAKLALARRFYARLNASA